jgi:hypothetical protein
MNGWEHYIENPECGAACGVGEVISADPMNLRTGPGLHAPVARLLDRGVLLYVFDPVPANDPAGEWLPVLLVQDHELTGWVHSSGVVQIFPFDDVGAAEKLRANEAVGRIGGA